MVAVIPIITAVGEFAAPHLIREATKIGGKKFIQKFGLDAWISITTAVTGGTIAQETPPVDLQNEKLFGTSISSLPGMPKNYTYSDIEEPKKPEPLKFIPGVHRPLTPEEEKAKAKLGSIPPFPIPEPKKPEHTGGPPIEIKPWEKPKAPKPIEIEQEYFPLPEQKTWKDYILYSKKNEKPEFKYPTKEEIEKYINEENEFWKKQYKSSNEERPELSPKNLPQIVEADKHFGAAAYAFQKFDNSKLIYISPEDYLSLTTGFRPEEGKEQLGSKMNVENIEKLLKEGKELANIPMLYVKKIDIGGSSIFEVDGQEGNHRAKAFKNLGYDKIPVVIEGNTRTHAKEIKDILPTSIQGKYGGIILTKPEDFYSVISKKKLFVKDITKQTKELVPEKPEFGKLTKTEIQSKKLLEDKELDVSQQTKNLTSKITLEKVKSDVKFKQSKYANTTDVYYKGKKYAEIEKRTDIKKLGGLSDYYLKYPSGTFVDGEEVFTAEDAELGFNNAKDALTKSIFNDLKREKKAHGGLIDKPLTGRSRYI